jgi:O-antigen/teichoic acid export membrane protein
VQRVGTLATATLVLWWLPGVTALAFALLVPAALTFAASLWRAWQLSAAEPGSVKQRVSFASSASDVLPIGAGILLSALYFRVDVLLIEVWNGPAAVGQYNAVFRLIEALRLFPAAVVAVTLPVLFRASDPRPLIRTSASVTLFGLGVALVLWIAATPLIGRLYGPGFVDAVPAFRILLLSFPLMSLNYVLTHQLIGWQGHRVYAGICFVALALNVGLNTRLIPAQSIVGAAWATVWTEVAITVGCALALGRLVGVSRPAWRAALGKATSR